MCYSVVSLIQYWRQLCIDDGCGGSYWFLFEGSPRGTRWDEWHRRTWESQLNMDRGKAELYCNLSIQDTNVVGLQPLQMYMTPKNKTILHSYNMQISCVLLNPTVNGVCSCRKIFVLDLQLIDLSLFWKFYFWPKRSTLRPCDYTLRQWGKKLRPPLFWLRSWLLCLRLEFITFLYIVDSFTTIFHFKKTSTNIFLSILSHLVWNSRKMGKKERKENGIVIQHPSILVLQTIRNTHFSLRISP